VSSAALHEQAAPLIAALPAAVACAPADASPGAVRHVYVTSVGDGPRTLPPSKALAGPAGLPIDAATDADGAFDSGL
jgi:hypothetical protein